MSATNVTAIGDLRREKLIAALLTGRSIVDAAETADVSYATARRWLQERDFRCQLRAASDEHRQAIMVGATAGAAEAVQALRLALRDQSAVVRVRAATALLAAHRYLTSQDLADRVDELERRLGG